MSEGKHAHHISNGEGTIVHTIIVPWSNGRFLHSKLRHPFPPLWCEGCGHNDMEYKRGQEMNRAIQAFLESVRGGGDRGGGEGKSPRDRRAARRASKPD